MYYNFNFNQKMVKRLKIIIMDKQRVCNMFHKIYDLNKMINQRVCYIFVYDYN